MSDESSTPQAAEPTVSAETIELDAERLKALENLADPLAKERVTELVERLSIETGLSLDDDRQRLFRHLIVELAKNIEDESLDPAIKQFLNGGGQAIDQIVRENFAQIKRAQAYFDDHGVAIITALFHASLPEAYLGKRGVQVLDATGELFRNWVRRVQETGQFLVNVLSSTPDLWLEGRTSLSRGEFGARATRRIRLTHAAVRWMLDGPPQPGHPSLLLERIENPTEWKARLIAAGLETSIGQPPLGQQDLLATLGTFTTVVLRALERLAVQFTDEDREAFHVLWNVVGWHLGIGDRATLVAASLEPQPNAWPESALLPISADEMDLTYDHLAKLLQEPSDAGRRMTKALMQELAYPLPQPLQRAPAFVARYLIGNNHADMLDIEQGGFFELAVAQSGALRKFTELARAGWVGRLSLGLVSRTVTRYALRTFITQSRWSERGLTIEPRIAGKWGIQIPPEPRTPARL